MSTVVKYREALNAALRSEMAADPSVVLLGEDIGHFGGVYAVTRGLYSEFGPDRVIDTPISEAAMIGMATGAAMNGLRPVVEIMYADFLMVCADQIINQAAKMRYMSGGGYGVPLTIRTQSGGWRGGGAQHTQTVESMFAAIPGLKVVLPATAADARGLLAAAVQDDDPVLVIEHRLLYATSGEVDDDPAPIPLGKARIARPGTDVTVATVSMMVHHAEAAAQTLADEGISVEVLDLRSLSPLDLPAVLESVGRTGRLVVAQQGHRRYGWAAELAATVTETAPELLQAPVRRVAAKDMAYPAARHLEDQVLPGPDTIAQVCRDLV